MFNEQSILLPLEISEEISFTVSSKNNININQILRILEKKV